MISKEGKRREEEVVRSTIMPPWAISSFGSQISRLQEGPGQQRGGEGEEDAEEERSDKRKGWRGEARGLERREEKREDRRREAKREEKRAEEREREGGR